MSTSPQIFVPDFAPASGSETPKRKRPSRYKPRLAQTVRWAMEDSLENTMKAQKIVREMLTWIEVEKAATGLEVGGEQLGAGRLARLGNLDHLVAELLLEVLALEGHIRPVVTNARTSTEPPESRDEGKPPRPKNV